MIRFFFLLIFCSLIIGCASPVKRNGLTTWETVNNTAKDSRGLPLESGQIVVSGSEQTFDVLINFMSNQVDYHEPGLYYSDPARMFDHCRQTFGRHVVLRHDYPLYEYTIYVYRS